jgi:hypothetical protein
MLKDEWRGALGVGHLSLMELYEGNLEEGSFIGHPEQYAN